MIRFNNDYNHGAHPEILEALASINGNSYGGYGEDEWCEKAAELIREKIRLCQEDTEGEIKREQTQEQRTEKDSMYELSAKNDRLNKTVVTAHIYNNGIYISW